LWLICNIAGKNEPTILDLSNSRGVSIYNSNDIEAGHWGDLQMKHLLIGMALTIGVGGMAVAADMPVKAPAPVFSWVGFYLGANVGWGTIQDYESPFCITPGGVVNGAGCIGGNLIPNAQVGGDGFLGGGQAGYNWQSGDWVFGVETDFQGSGISGSVNIPGPLGVVGGGGATVPGSFVADEKLSWLGTVRGRVGVAYENVLFYGTGGLAYGGVKVDSNFIFPGIQFPATGSATKAGWTLGGGVEYAFAGNWSAKVEGLYYDLGSISISGPGVPPNGFIGGKSFDVQGAIVRVGLNWRFGGAGYAY
jgi:outer membrane immunogenic protein